MAQIRMIEDALNELPEYIGAQPFSDDDLGQDQVIKLADFIRRNFEEIDAILLDRLFEKAAAGTLKDGYGNTVSINTYGKRIGIELLGNICRAHRQAQAKHVKIQPKDQEYSWRSPKEHYEELMDCILETGEMPQLRLWQTIYTHLQEIGEIKKDTSKPKKRAGRAAQKLDDAMAHISTDRYRELLIKHFKSLLPTKATKA